MILAASVSFDWHLEAEAQLIIIQKTKSVFLITLLLRLVIARYWCSPSALYQVPPPTKYRRYYYLTAS